MTAQEFLNKYAGQSLSYDGLEVNRGQCVQAVCFYCRDNGLPVMWADAAYWFLNFSQGQAYDKIANDHNNPNQVPSGGDIIIWGTNLPNSGGAGHIAVVLSAQPGSATFTSVDSNWGGKTVHAVTHNWSYVIGWLHPKTTPPQGGNMPSLTNSGDVTNLYRQELGREPDEAGMNSFNNKPWPDVWYGIINSDERSRYVSDRQAQLDRLNTTINQLNQTITDVTGQENLTKQEAQNALAKVAELTAQLETAHDELIELQSKPPTIVADPDMKAEISAIHKLLLSIKGMIANLFKKK